MSELHCAKHEWYYDSVDELGCYPCSIEQSERKRLTKMLMDNKVIRRDALGSLVFVNCNTLEVEYLNEKQLNNE